MDLIAVDKVKQGLTYGIQCGTVNHVNCVVSGMPTRKEPAVLTAAALHIYNVNT